ncbi:hypothetical protein ACIGW3_33110 [Streptomyces sp. NPDC053499]|uniref:hypothetical protein n=1 Tax=Streptomyces sp. NPDC053499 TaxID=3365707 RepID=UPI0037D20F52
MSGLLNGLLLGVTGCSDQELADCAALTTNSLKWDWEGHTPEISSPENPIF